MLKFQELKPESLNECMSLLDQVLRQYPYPIGGSWNRQKLNDEICGQRSLAAYSEQGVIQGFCLYRKVTDFYEITFLATRISCQQKGVMRTLLTNLINQLDVGEKIWLEVHEGNLPAIRFYESFGFQRTGCRPKYYADLGDALLYEYKPLQ